MQINAVRYSQLNGAPKGVLNEGMDLSGLITTIGAEISTLVVNVPVVVSTNTTIPSTLSVEVLNGAVISIPNGVTLTIDGPFTAGIYQVFNCVGTGAVVFNSQYTTVGYPEWWGAVTDDNTVDSSVGINAAIIALSVVQLQKADYYIQNTVNVSRNNVSVKGVSVRFTGNNSCTRLIMRNGTAKVMFVGLSGYPSGGINFFAQQIYIQDIELTRDVAPVPPAPGSEINGPTGMVLQFALLVYLTRVKCSEHVIGFTYNGVVASYADKCQSFKTTVASPPANDFFWGWYINGQTSLPTAGGNASIYFSECSTSIGGAPTLPTIGMNLFGAYTDTFIDKFETANCDYGFVLTGMNAVAPDPKYNIGNIDIHITQPIIDQYKTNGIYIYASSDYANINVIDGYYAPQSTSIGACISIEDSGGITNLTNNQCIGFGATGAGVGISIVNSAGVNSTGNSIVGAQKPIVMSAARNCRITDFINNIEQPSVYAAVNMTDCLRNYIAPFVFRSNVSGSFTTATYGFGVNMSSTGNAGNEINCSGIDAAVINGGSANKLLNNSVQITATGSFGSNNLASGIML
jgi:hypothetical protein